MNKYNEAELLFRREMMQPAKEIEDPDERNEANAKIPLIGKALQDAGILRDSADKVIEAWEELPKWCGEDFDKQAMLTWINKMLFTIGALHRR